jgi:acyl-CoA thioester hydrolase
MPSSSELQLRFADLDYLGHVTAAAYLMFFEEARVNWLVDLWRTPFPAYVVARQEIEFLREVALDDSPVELSIDLVHLGTSSFDVEESLTVSSGFRTTRSKATLVAWDRPGRCARPLAEAERRGLESQLGAS